MEVNNMSLAITEIATKQDIAQLKEDIRELKALLKIPTDIKSIGKGLLTENGASEFTGFKVGTLRKRRWQGLPPKFLKVGSKIFYDTEILMEFLKSCEQNSTSDTAENNR